jgi:lysophospholipase L1-like esterase
MNTWNIAISLLFFVGMPILYAEDMPQERDIPKVLIIGDSISIGYRPHVAQLLEGKAEITHRGNAEHTGTGLARLDQWLGNEKWDVIHFNWGLWDLCYRNPEAKTQGNRDKVNGTITTTLTQYEENLDRLVTRLKETGARLVWASTTVVPENEIGRVCGEDRIYNELAAKVMRKHGVLINDLHALTMTFPPELFVSAGNVHYTTTGYQKIAEQVADRILTAIRGEQTGEIPEAEGDDRVRPQRAPLQERVKTGRSAS